MSKILIVAPYTSLPGEPYFNRFIYLASLLANNHDVTLITSNFKHFDKEHRNLNSDTLKIKGFTCIFIGEPGYKTNVSISRVFSHFIFTRNFKKFFINCNIDYDIVYSAYPLIEPNIFLGKMKLERKFKLLIDIQDVWPEAISCVIPFIDKMPLNYLPFTRNANKAYKSADGLVAVSDTYLQRGLSANKNVPGISVYIGSDIDQAEIDNLKQDFNTLKLAYVGTLSFSYDVETIILAVNNLVSNGLDIEFHIFGTGPFKEKLISLSCEKVIFHGLLSYNEMINALKNCDVAINSLSETAKQSVTNKLSDYLLLGLPIINSQRNVEVIELLKTVNSIHYIPGDIKSAENAIELMYKNRLKLVKQPNLSFSRKEGYENLVNFIEGFL